MRITALICLGLFLLSSCFFNSGVTGSGNVINQSRSVEPFHSIDLSGKGQLFVTQGDHKDLEIEGEDNILDIMTTEVKGGVLYIDYEENLGKTKPIKIFCSAEEFKNFSISGAGKIIGESLIEGEELNFDLSGASDITLEVAVKKMRTEISGAGEAEFSGEAEEHIFNASGASELEAMDLKTMRTSIDISGSGSARVHCDEKLKAQISGAGSVRYKGNAEVSQSISGAGSIKKAEAS